MKFTAELGVLSVNEKDVESDVMLVLENEGDEITKFVFTDGDKTIAITVDRDDLLEAVARVSGGDIRIAKED